MRKSYTSSKMRFLYGTIVVALRAFFCNGFICHLCPARVQQFKYIINIDENRNRLVRQDMFR